MIGMKQETYDHIKNNLHLLDINIETGEIKGRKLRPGKNHGRLLFKLKNKRVYVHHVIAIAGGLNPVGKTVNHKDGNYLNNRFDNLEIVTQIENLKHAHKHNLIPIRRGSEVNTAKLTIEQAREVKRLALNREMKMQDIADMFGISYSAVRKIKSGTNWVQLNEED